MQDETVVAVGHLRFVFSDEERADEARKWLNKRGPMFSPAEFFDRFPEVRSNFRLDKAQALYS
jgi:hypothetical protein